MMGHAPLAGWGPGRGGRARSRAPWVETRKTPHVPLKRPLTCEPAKKQQWASIRLRGRDWAVGSVPDHPGPGGHGHVLGRTLERGAGPKPKWRLTTGWAIGWATGWHPSLELLEGQKGRWG